MHLQGGDSDFQNKSHGNTKIGMRVGVPQNVLEKLVLS